ncbi:MAG: DNA methyltransferase, partial [Candidatus Cybelea sp.]
MSRRPADLHADWLRLVEPEGQFLTLPVLRRAFPDGLEAVTAAVREQLRERYPRTADPTQSDWDAWFDWLARDALAWGPHYRCGEEAAAFAHAVPEYGVVLRADAALCDPETRNPRVLVMRYPHGTPLDHRLAGERWNASPVDRLTLLCRAQGVRIGLLTDGERVMLVWVPGAGPGGHATWETALFTESRERNLFQSFISLLHASHFFAVREDQQLEALFEASEKAQNEVTGQLGLQVRQAVELLVSALSRADLERGGALLSGVSPHRVYEAAATVMMRLVFLLYAEERDLLPLADPLYAEHYAASTLREQLDEQATMEGDEPLERRGAAWFRLLALFRIIYAGLNHDRLRIPPYGGRLFDPDRFAFLEGRRADETWSDAASRPLPVDDLTVRAILEAIQTLPIRESGSKERRRLSFRSLDVEQIGHVYEGLLDHGAERVDDVYVGLVGKTGEEAEIPLADLENAAGQGQQPLVSFLHDFTGKSPSAIEKLIERGRAVADGRDVEARRLVNTVCDNNAALAGRVSPFVYALRTDLHGLPVVFPPESLVVRQTRERRDSGTEYTPRELAEEMVRYALEPLAYSPGPRDGIEPNRWRLRLSSELLDLKICDPAVGSGAFLVSACRYLADRVVEAWVTENPERARGSRDDLTLEARRAVIGRCLYGVDRDPMAVEMAKLSLWLITMARERPFSFLDHSICEGDSLIGISSLDQLRYLHVNPESGRAVHARTHVDATAFVQPLVEKATALRLELE